MTKAWGLSLKLQHSLFFAIGGKLSIFQRWHEYEMSSTSNWHHSLGIPVVLHAMLFSSLCLFSLNTLINKFTPMQLWWQRTANIFPSDICCWIENVKHHLHLYIFHSGYLWAPSFLSIHLIKHLQGRCRECFANQRNCPWTTINF